MALKSSQLKALQKLIRHQADPLLARLVEKIHPADLADAIPQLTENEQRKFVEVLFEARRAGATLSELPEETLEEILAMISDPQLALLIGRQPSDDAIFFLSQLSEERVQSVRSHLTREQLAEFDQLLLHPEGSAGSMMTTKVLAMKEDATAQDAINEIRRQGSELEAIFYLYVVDEEGILSGVVPLRQLILSPPEAKLYDLMQRNPISAKVDDDQERVAGLVAKYNFLSLPVVDEEGRLAGVVTVDDVIDVIHEEATEDIYHMAGLGEEVRVSSPILESARRRGPWTLVNLGTAGLASLIISLYSGSIERIVALAALMPVVAGLGGNSGTQSLAVTIRSLTLGEMVFASAWQVLARQLAVGLLVGAAAGLVTGLGVYLWNGNPWMGLVVFLAMLANMAMGAFAGAAIPMFLKLVRLDPAMGSGILVTGLTDSFGFLAFLGLASLFLQRLA